MNKDDVPAPVVTLVTPEPPPVTVRIEVDLATAEALRTALLFFGRATEDDRRLDDLWRQMGAAGVGYAQGGHGSVYLVDDCDTLAPCVAPTLTVRRSE